jgi:putative protein kinase ArgK-like GTPase of G3E family
MNKAIARVLEEFRAGKPAALARAVSIVENHRPGFEQILAAVHPTLGRARRIGVTGPPGAGKSTLTTRLARRYREAGLRVGIVAVDPTSPFTGGALLGDRIRMEEVALDPGVFIRSMATRGSLGGLATATREVCDVLDGFGMDVILLETVGVGQSELDIARAADTTLVVLVPESGDSIQTLKAGVMEIADVFAVKIAQSGGLVPAMQVAAIAQLAGISLYGGTMLEGAVGTAASAHVFSTFGELQFGTELFGPLLLTQELLTEPLQYRDFMLQVPTGPGLGIEIDRDKLARLRRQ